MGKFPPPVCSNRQPMLILRLKEMPNIVAMVTLLFRLDIITLTVLAKD